jgi:hypothetical protein
MFFLFFGPDQLKQVDPASYSITVRKVMEKPKAIYEALIAEFPDVIERAESHTEAYELALDTIATLRDIAVEHGTQFPRPMAARGTDGYSGRVTLRMSRSLHANVSQYAELDGVSLNTWIEEAMAMRLSSGLVRPVRQEVDVDSREDLRQNVDQLEYAIKLARMLVSARKGRTSLRFVERNNELQSIWRDMSLTVKKLRRTIESSGKSPVISSEPLSGLPAR